jgi:hypothetical protein
MVARQPATHMLSEGTGQETSETGEKLWVVTAEQENKKILTGLTGLTGLPIFPLSVGRGWCEASPSPIARAETRKHCPPSASAAARRCQRQFSRRRHSDESRRPDSAPACRRPCREEKAAASVLRSSPPSCTPRGSWQCSAHRDSGAPPSPPAESAPWAAPCGFFRRFRGDSLSTPRRRAPGERRCRQFRVQLRPPVAGASTRCAGARRPKSRPTTRR